MKLVLISDTHNRHDDLYLPPGDVLVCAGDFSFFGFEEEVLDFARWLDSLDFKHKIVVPGNHETSFDNKCSRGRRVVSTAADGTLIRVPEQEARAWLSTSCHLLIDEELVLHQNGKAYKFYGSPYTPAFFDWAFNSTKDDLSTRWNKIPEDTDVLITHGPPYDILDECPDSRRVGCNFLLERVRVVEPKLHVFGHIHHSYGQQQVGKTTFVNAAICGEDYRPTNKPIVFEL